MGTNSRAGGRATFSADEILASDREIGNIGWHIFRHTYSTLLHSLGTTPAVQKELLRHADIRTTMNVYTQAVSHEKRAAASKVAQTLYESVLAGRREVTVSS